MRTATLVILGLVLCSFTVNATVATSGGDCTTNTCPENEYCVEDSGASTFTCTACDAGTARATAQSTAGAETDSVCTACGTVTDNTAGADCDACGIYHRIKLFLNL